MTDYSATAPARLATRLAFVAAGFAMACCAPLFPFFKSAVGAEKDVFGLILLCLGIGAVVAMPLAGIVIARKGPRGMILLGGYGMALILPLIAYAPTPVALGALMLLFGASLGIIDVAMNVHGAEVEGIEARALMSNFHAHWSIGGVFGAGLVTALLWVGVSYQICAVLGGVLTALTVYLTGPRIMQADVSDPPPLTLPRGIVLLLAVLAAVCFLVEGAVLDWGALLMIDRGLADPQVAGTGYIVFSAAMMVGRLSGDWTVERAGAFLVLALGGAMVMTGIAVLVLVPSHVLAWVGFALIGLGAANLVPVVFSAAGRQTIMPPSLAVAAVTTTGYAGLLLGPALMGFMSEIYGLSVAFWGLAALIAAYPLFARTLSRI